MMRAYVKRALAAAGLAIALTACGSTTLPPPLPSDVKVSPPGRDVPRALAAFSGTWIGVWGAVQTRIGGETMLVAASWPVESILVVERIEGRMAWIVYAWGANANIPEGGSTRTLGSIGADGTLRAKLPTGAELEYRLSADQQSMSGTYRLRGVPMFGDFKRRP